MRVKQIINDKVNSFEFSCNLTKYNRLEKILSLFELKKVYVCMYGLSQKTDLSNNSKELKIQYLSKIGPSKYAICIDSEKISVLLSIIDDDCEEITVWSCDTDWESFTKSMTEKHLFSFHKSKVEKTFGFYLDFDYHDNSVDIICDLQFNNSRNIKKEDMVNLLINK